MARFMSQQALADKTGFTRRTIIGWEKGIRLPYMRNILKLADALGCQPEELMEPGAWPPKEES